jgi:hypothetical protein
LQLQRCIRSRSNRPRHARDASRASSKPAIDDDKCNVAPACRNVPHTRRREAARTGATPDSAGAAGPVNQQERTIMQRKLISHTPGVILAGGLMFGVAAAQAASGSTVEPREESMVTVGMDAAQVEQAIGRPAEKEKFAVEPGPTWTYRVAGNDSVFDVDFGADGKVASVSERTELSRGQ